MSTSPLKQEGKTSRPTTIDDCVAVLNCGLSTLNYPAGSNEAKLRVKVQAAAMNRILKLLKAECNP